MKHPRVIRKLVVVLGDQLNHQALALDGFDDSVDVIWMAEVHAENLHVPSHKARSVLFLSAMRHFCAEQEGIGRRVLYHPLSERQQSLASALEKTITGHRIETVVLTKPGDFRVERSLTNILDEHGQNYEILKDNHFICDPDDFESFGANDKNQRMEFFYRRLRKETGYLMEGNLPVGGKWNYDDQNRGSFKKHGPQDLVDPIFFKSDAITKEVIKEVENAFPENPGSIENFNWPVTRSQALKALVDFVQKRLPNFGKFQDAMWSGQSWLYHSRLSVCLNLKLISPKEVLTAAEKAYHSDHASLSSVEGFIRQILGWREFVRLIHHHRMPEYVNSNSLNAQEDLPNFFWTGDTEMSCLNDCIQQTLSTGYNHHIQRLMVTGLYTLMLGVNPKQVHEWFLSMYVDAVEWVEMPNVIGMSQFADGGVMGSKPYVATGKYINRMSNYCKSCRYDPSKSTGKEACPFTTLYWDFLDKHHEQLRTNPRMSLQLRNLERIEPLQLQLIKEQAALIRQHGTVSLAA